MLSFTIETYHVLFAALRLCVRSLNGKARLKYVSGGNSNAAHAEVLGRAVWCRRTAIR